MTRVVDWLYRTLGRYPEQLGAPGGFPYRTYWVWAPREDRAASIEDAMPTVQEMCIELHDYRNDGAWAYRLDGVWYAFTPALVLSSCGGYRVMR